MALEKRIFTSADGAKTFEGRLTDYDARQATVTVRKGMRNIRFKLSLLSKEDVAYVKENANALATITRRFIPPDNNRTWISFLLCRFSSDKRLSA